MLMSVLHPPSVALDLVRLPIDPRDLRAFLETLPRARRQEDARAHVKLLWVLAVVTDRLRRDADRLHRWSVN